MACTNTSAWIAASAALFAVFLTQFLAESFRRFKDGSAIAGGLAGELKSYEDAIPILRARLCTFIEHLKAGQTLTFRPFDKPVDRFFDEVVGKLGVLEPELIKQIIYVYNNLNAFRGAFVLITQNHAEMHPKELLSRLELCSEAFERADSAGIKLVAALQARSGQRFLF